MSRIVLVICLLVGMLSSSGCRRAPALNNPKIEPIASDDADIDQDPRLIVRYNPEMSFGLTVAKDAMGKPLQKKLTFAPLGRQADGSTNDTLVRIDKNDVHFGTNQGKWGEKNVKFGTGIRSVWTSHYIQVTQLVEVVPSKQPVELAPDVRKRVLDTCLVRYELENHDSSDHNVGLRVLVDTFIGQNDGVPFAVPNLPGLVKTVKDFPKPEEVPDFVQALENPDLRNPGTVGLMTFKVGGDVEPPSRVSLTAWPNLKGLPGWEIRLQHMGDDSAVVMYWNADKVLKPGERRIVGFSYGLGRLSGNEGTGKLALTVNGNFTKGGMFTVTTYVNKPAKDQTLTLELPNGMQLAAGNATAIVPPPAQGPEGGDTSIVTWTVRANDAGKHPIRVRSSTGVSQAQEVTIRGE